MDVLTNDLLNYFQGFFFPFLRLTGLFLTAPFFNSHSIPRKLRLIFSLMLALPVSANLPHFPPIDMISLQGLLTIAEQMLIGIAIGLVIKNVRAGLLLGLVIGLLTIGLAAGRRK